MEHEYWMREALKEAKIAFDKKEVPIGAVIVKDNKIIGRGHNQVETLNDPTAHAEIIAISSASNTIGNWRLNNTTLYVTKEPCPMCAGAIILARIPICVFGTKDEKLGSLGSVYTIVDKKIKIVSGIMEKECATLIKSFFNNIREK